MQELVPMYYQNWSDQTQHDPGIRYVQMLNKVDPKSVTIMEESIVQPRSKNYVDNPLIRPMQVELRHPDLVIGKLNKAGKTVLRRVGEVGCYVTSLFNSLTLSKFNPWSDLASYIAELRLHSMKQNKPMFLEDGSFAGDYSRAIPGFKSGHIYALSEGRFIEPITSEGQATKDKTKITTETKTKTGWDVTTPDKVKTVTSDRTMILVKVLVCEAKSGTQYSNYSPHWLSCSYSDFRALVYNKTRTLRCYNPWSNNRRITADGEDLHSRPLKIISGKHFQVTRPRSVIDTVPYFGDKEFKLLGAPVGFSDNKDLDSGWVEISADDIVQIRQIVYNPYGSYQYLQRLAGGVGGVIEPDSIIDDDAIPLPSPEEMVNNAPKSVQVLFDINKLVKAVINAIENSDSWSDFGIKMLEYARESVNDMIGDYIAAQIGIALSAAAMSSGELWLLPSILPLEAIVSALISRLLYEAEEVIIDGVKYLFSINRSKLPDLRDRWDAIVYYTRRWCVC